MTEEKDLMGFARKIILEVAQNTDDWTKQHKNYQSIIRDIISHNVLEKKYLVLEAMKWIDENKVGSPSSLNAIQSIRIILLKENLPFKETEILDILKWSVRYGKFFTIDISETAKTVIKYSQDNKISPELKQQVVLFLNHFENTQLDSDTRKTFFRLKNTCNILERNPIVAGEVWSDAAISDISLLSYEMLIVWVALINESQKANGSAPTAKWKKSVEALLEKIGFEEFKAHVLRWFPLVDKPRTAQIASWSEWSPNPNLMLNDVNADILKGLVWCCGLREDKEFARVLMNLAISAYKKVPMIGPRCVRVGNACVWALGQMNLVGVGQLAILKLKVKFGTAQKGIEKALNETAKKVGLPAEELEEMSVPNYGLAEVGLLRESFGEFAAELVVTGTNSAEIRWFNADGKQQKSVPTFVKDNHAEELKELN
ncbi:MAG TPA: hypothetical protein PKE69_15400, partial [Pyrinomonadaceae bacterium]|nr:hypothetical protein [Pyrinomonadaceae bacterium]